MSGPDMALSSPVVEVPRFDERVVPDEGGWRVGQCRASLDRSASVNPGPFQEALGRLGPRRHLCAMRRTHVLDGRRDDRVPDGAGQRRLGRGQRHARLGVDTVVVAGQALDDEPLERGRIPARLHFRGQFAQLCRRGPHAYACALLASVGRPAWSCPGWYSVSHVSAVSGRRGPVHAAHEHCERPWVMVTSNLVFSQWDRNQVRPYAVTPQTFRRGAQRARIAQEQGS